MFTGIVEELGELAGRDELTDAARLIISGPAVTADARHGDSVAVNGVCLTVVEVLPGGRFTADVMRETLGRSSLGQLRVGSPVDCEVMSRTRPLLPPSLAPECGPNRNRVRCRCE